MRYAVWLVCAAIFMACGSQSSQNQEEGIVLEGTVEQYNPSMFVHLEMFSEQGIIKIDTLDLDSDGSFSSTVQIFEDGFYRMNFNDRQYVSLVLTGDEEVVTINAHGNDPGGFSEVSGSYDTEFKNQMDLIMQNYQQERAQFQQQQIQASRNQDAEAFHAAANSVMQLGITAEMELKKLIREASPSLAAIHGLQMIDSERNIEFMDSIAKEMITVMPENFQVQRLVSELAGAKSLSVGAQAPDFSLPNPDGEMISLSSLKGKYVLIDFWAAWCGPCRRENPNVVSLYKEYAHRNFEILGVSLDKNKEAWLQAIDQDGLPWIHVSDLKFWQSEVARLYQVSTIPATYLIDPDGKIIAKNLRGASLEAKLKELFG